MVMAPTRADYRIFRTLMTRWNENNLAMLLGTAGTVGQTFLKY
jgi:hypothetical protein